MSQTVITKFENKVWLILLVVLAVVLLSGFFVYRSLSGIVNGLTEEARPDETVILMKEVLYDLTDAENNVKSYSLTNEIPYLEDYNLNVTEVEEKIGKLRELTADDADSKLQVDSLDVLIHQKFFILEDMLLLRGQSRVTNALDRVATHIETSAAEDDGGVFSQEDKVITAEQEKAEEDKFFKKLLNKRKKNEETSTQQNPEEITEEAVVDPNEKITLDEINQEILQIKKEEARIDKSVREKELLLIQEDKKVMDRILAMFVQMEEKETLSMDEKLALADTKSRQTNILIGLFCILACVLLVIAGYAVNTYVKRNEAFKIALRKAKQETDAKNREITDSITYAQKIQEAILPDRKLFAAYLKESFVLYKPKDIVAGDFYWTVKTDDRLFVAVADCTGHGVPGAMVSVVCSTALNRCVREFELKQPAQILEKCRELVIETFASGDYSVNDGMDIALISLKYTLDDGKEVALIEYSGANNSLYIVKNTALQTVPADKQPIGKYQYQKPFTNHKLIIERGSMLYLFSDGYADQFGGQYGKKFKYKQFQELLSASSRFDTDRQLDNLENTFESWRGSLEQIDDVCVIGVRL
ncbi:MAG: SpoIIE family protein phosphatase [Bacteroidetes bacterium]|nr:SpoIIE family protein phosphatase [Bacteroidota bacterium]